jgi:gluconokinase
MRTVAGARKSERDEWIVASRATANWIKCPFKADDQKFTCAYRRRHDSPANIAKMHSGIPLDDDRLPWLQAIAKEIDRWRAERRYGVIACSALKRRYRDIIIGERLDVQLVYLCGDRSLIAKRLAARQGHFMPKQLLESQFETLEEPAPEERAITIWVGRPPSMLVDEIVAALRARANAPNLSPKEIIRSPRGSQRPPSGFRWSRKR